MKFARQVIRRCVHQVVPVQSTRQPLSLESLEGRLLLSVSVGPGEWVSQVHRHGRVDSSLAALTADVLPLSADTTAPTVTKVFISGAAWTPAFRTYLQSQGLGDSAYGYAVPVGSGAQLASLPWNDIDQLSVRFSENVSVDRSDLALTGVNVADANYAAAISGGSFAYDSLSYTATWALSSPIGLDKLMLTLNAYGTNPVKDASNNSLDGEWANPKIPAAVGTDTFPSGDGAARGNFAFRFNVNPGDADPDAAVGSDDVSAVRAALLTGTGAGAAYSAFKDINGNGLVQANDISAARNPLLAALPTAEPVSKPASTYAVIAGPTTSNGITTYTIASDYQLTPVNVYVLLPTNYNPANHYKVLYVLPAWSNSPDGINRCKAENIANANNIICVGPDEAEIPGYPSQGPWYGDNPDNPKIRNDSYIPDVIVPFIDQTYSTVASADGRMTIGFSKSGVGAVSELLRHPTVFGRAGAWDAPLNMTFQHDEVYGNVTYFNANYYIPNLITANQSWLKTSPARIAMAGLGFGGTQPVDAQMTQLGIPHYCNLTATGTHAWNSGWLGPLVSVLMTPDMTTAAPIGPLPG